jgi:predicted 3-demethylubiquinone-9 3-methyltransferase (glyoxalase superfamily)
MLQRFFRANITGKTKIERVIFLSFSYKEQYAVIVICKNEEEQETVYNRLLAEGYKLKVVAV